MSLAIRLETDVRMITIAKDELAIDRLDEGVRTIQVKVGMIETLQNRIVALEGAAANANMAAAPPPSIPTGNALSE